MAVTGSKNSIRSRMDFGAALDNALTKPVRTEVREESSEIEVAVKTPEKEPPFTESQGDVKMIQEEPKVEDKKPKKTQKEAPAKKNKAEKFQALSKGERGRQKSIYFESDVILAVEEIAKEYNTSVAKVINILLREALEL